MESENTLITEESGQGEQTALQQSIQPIMELSNLIVNARHKLSKYYVNNKYYVLPEDIQSATEIGVESKKVLDQIEKKRKEVKAPILELGNGIDAFAKEIGGPLEKDLAKFKEAILETKKELKLKAEKDEMERKEKEEKEKRKAEEKKAAQDAIRKSIKDFEESTTLLIEQCDNKEALQSIISTAKQFSVDSEEFKSETEDAKVRLITLAKTKLSNPSHFEKVKMEVEKEKRVEDIKIKKQELEELQAQTTISIRRTVEEKTISKQVQQSTKGIAKNLKFQLEDITAVPVEWLIVDESKVREWLKENRQVITEQLTDAESVQKYGLKFYYEENLKLR